MHRPGLKLERKSWRQALALLGCLLLLYFAGGGILLHHHTGGPDTACPVCHSLHLPALAAAQLELFPQLRQVIWHAFTPHSATPRDSFALHRASRAPPAA